MYQSKARRLAAVFLLIFTAGLLLTPAVHATDERKLGFMLLKGTESAASKSGTGSYKVQKGDTLWSIAQKFGTSVDILKSTNSLTNNMLRIGQELVIPALGSRSPASYSETPKYHTVAPGDTLWKISRQYKVGMKNILALNLGINPNNLRVGQQVNLPGRPNQLAYQPSSRGNSAVLLTWPLLGTITSGFGQRNGEYHHGVDIAEEQGYTIRAAGAGTVVFAGWRSVYGKTLIIDHGSGLSTLYGHNSELLVEEGDRVEAGDEVAKLGSTGRTTGPHLHFEVRVNDQPVNPLLYLRH